MKKPSEKRNTNTSSFVSTTALVPYQETYKTKTEADIAVLDVEQYLNMLRNNQYNQGFLKLVMTDSLNLEEEEQLELIRNWDLHWREFTYPWNQFSNLICEGVDVASAHIAAKRSGYPSNLRLYSHHFCRGSHAWSQDLNTLFNYDKNLMKMIDDQTTFRQRRDIYTSFDADYVLMYQKGVPIGDITRTDGILSYQSIPQPLVKNISLIGVDIPLQVLPASVSFKPSTSGVQGRWSDGPVQMLMGAAAVGFNFVKNRFGFGQASVKPLALVKVSTANTATEKPEAAESTQPEAQTQRKVPPQSSFIRTLGIDDYLTVANYLVHFVNAPWTLWANRERPLKDTEQKQLIEHQTTLAKLTHQFTFHRPVRAEESGAFADKFKFVETELRALPQDMQKMLTCKKTSTTAFNNLATRLQRVSDQMKLLGNISHDLKLINQKAKKLAKKADPRQLGMMVKADATTGRLNYKVLDAFETQTQKQITQQAQAESQFGVQSKNLVFSSTKSGTQSAIGSPVPGPLPQLKM